METRKLFVLSIVFTAISVITLGYTIFSRDSNLSAFYLTQPVNSLTGRVAGIKGKVITLEKTAKTPAGATVRLTYQISVSDSTRYNQQILPLDYYAKNIHIFA